MAAPLAAAAATVDTATTTAKPGRAPLRMRHPDYSQADALESSDSDREASDSEGETTAVDDGTYQDDNFVRKVLAKERPLPPITLKTLPQNINVISTLALTVVPALAIYGAFTTQIKWQTALWSVIYYFYTGLGTSSSSRVPSPSSSSSSLTKRRPPSPPSGITAGSSSSPSDELLPTSKRVTLSEMFETDSSSLSSQATTVSGRTAATRRRSRSSTSSLSEDPALLRVRLTSSPPRRRRSSGNG